jgi:hypothetical protein
MIPAPSRLVAVVVRPTIRFREDDEDGDDRDWSIGAMSTWTICRPGRRSGTGRWRFG